MLDGKQNPAETDADKLLRTLDLELMQKRAGWQQAKARRSTVRTLCFLFLFVIVAAAIAAFFFFGNPERVRELRSTHASPSPAAKVTPP
ncbi:MAG: hypothetical protein M3Z22_04030 [Verrucomicrobiota bacterium]|nr:hypothetical protein [Verrucomicrobiota bacterium]